MDPINEKKTSNGLYFHLTSSVELLSMLKGRNIRPDDPKWVVGQWGHSKQYTTLGLQKLRVF